MAGSFHITPVRSAADLVSVAALFRAYATSLDVDLTYQNFAEELAALPGPYAPPVEGTIFMGRGI